MKKNDIVTIEITDINNLGHGVGRHDGVVIFVAGGVSGDMARVKIIKANKKRRKNMKIQEENRCSKERQHKKNNIFLPFPSGPLHNLIKEQNKNNINIHKHKAADDGHQRKRKKRQGNHL